MADEDNVLYLRCSGNKVADSNADDVWDDSVLIKAYDKAVNLAKEEVAKRIGMDVQTTQTKQKSPNYKQFRPTNTPYKWTVGADCRATYSEDGKTYEATICKILGNTGMCIVEFIGYGNTEKVELNALLESEGLECRIAQEKSALGEKCSVTSGKRSQKMDFDGDETRSFKNSFPLGATFSSTFDTIPPAPPLPPQLMAKLPENDADALSSMLMSWYISGFHTGYYHGLKHAKDNQEKKKSC